MNYSKHTNNLKSCLKRTKNQGSEVLFDNYKFSYAEAEGISKIPLFRY